MFGGVRGRTGLGLVLSASALLAVATAPAYAADLGGDCCSDLEERVAELEATVAKKGNRKVSLTISGFVNEGVQWWDDGSESNLYVGTNGSDPTRFRFVGKAKIDKDWSAGYIIEIGLGSARQDSYSATTDDNTSVGIRHSAWYLESKTYGKLTVGQTSAVNDGITEMSPAKTTVNKQITIFSPNSSFQLRNSTTGTAYTTTWGNLQRGGGGEGDRFNVVRYDSPEFAGFVASANWGEDDFWAVALRYKGELHGFKLAAGISYGEITDDSQGFTGGSTTTGNDEGTTLGGSASVLHEDTGLYVSFAYGKAELAISGNDTYENWSIQGGIQKKFNPLGKTTVYGEYFEGDFGAASGNAGITASDVTVYGLTAIQGIDAAAMELYLSYRHYEADAFAGATKLSLDDFDTVMSGAKINF